MNRCLNNLQNNQINKQDALLIYLFNQSVIIIHTAIKEPAGVAIKLLVLKSQQWNFWIIETQRIVWMIAGPILCIHRNINPVNRITQHLLI